MGRGPVMRAFRRSLPAILFLFAGCGVRCGGKGGVSTDASDGGNVSDGLVDTDARDPDVLVPPDARPDVWDGGQQTGPVIELPPSGQLEIYGFTNAGHFATYSEYRGDPVKFADIYYYDVLAQAEHKVTDREAAQVSPYVHGNEIMFTDVVYDARIQDYQGETYLYNITSATETRLTDTVTRDESPKFNEDYIIYHSNQGCSNANYYNLSLLNRHTSEVTLLADCDQGAETSSIGQHFAAWTARPYTGHNKDIHVRDLAGGVTFRIESTDVSDQYFPHTDDDHVIWMDYRDGRREIYMHSFSTGEEVCLTPDEWEQAWPTLRNGMAAWCDYRYSQEWGENGRCDVYVYEIATGVGRRVTTQSDTWQPRFVDSGWILYGLWITQSNWKLYAHDLVADGILTTDGHVIP